MIKNIERAIRKSSKRGSQKWTISVCGAAIAAVAISIVALLAMAGIIALVACAGLCVYYKIKQEKSREERDAARRHASLKEAKRAKKVKPFAKPFKG